MFNRKKTTILKKDVNKRLYVICKIIQFCISDLLISDVELISGNAESGISKYFSATFFLSSYTESITVIRSRFVLVIRTDAEPARNGEFTRQGPMKRIV